MTLELFAQDAALQKKSESEADHLALANSRVPTTTSNPGTPENTGFEDMALSEQEVALEKGEAAHLADSRALTTTSNRSSQETVLENSGLLSHIICFLEPKDLAKISPV